MMWGLSAEVWHKNWVRLTYKSLFFHPEPCIDGEIQIEASDYGRLEICMNGVWGRVCGEMWTNRDSQVACRQLGFSTYGRNTEKLYNLAV